jgi:ParB/RepB/Spo0J family partition protein
MELDLHQLVLRYEHLRVRRPERERRLLASLATSGQQVPIVVVPAKDEPGRYLVIDGYKRIHALRLLGKDTVRAAVWQMTEAEALVLDRSLRVAEGETALEQGWLLSELARSFGHSLEDLARQFDRSASWVSRRLALVELLPESVQQKVRAGEINAHVAMKYLVPVARISLEDCLRLADAIAAHKFNTREAGQVYGAWRDSSPKIRKRILENPKLFLKADEEVKQQPPCQPSATAGFLRDLEIVSAVASRAAKRWRSLAGLIDGNELKDARRYLECALDDLSRLGRRIEEESTHVNEESTDSNPGTARTGSEDTQDRTDLAGVSPGGETSDPIGLDRCAAVAAAREGGPTPPADPGALCLLQGEPGPSP